MEREEEKFRCPDDMEGLINLLVFEGRFVERVFI